MVLRAAEGLDPLSGASARLVHVLRDRCRSDEAHGCDAGMLEDRVHRLSVALNDVEHAVGHARLSEQLSQEQRGRRILLARLEHERVPARDRVRHHPQRHHDREVERCDARDDTERLADRVHVDAGRDLLAVRALQVVRQPARELDDFDCTRHLAACVGEHLAVLGRDGGGEIGPMPVDELAEAEEHLGPLRQRGRPPRGERTRRFLDGRIHLLGRSQVDLARLGAGGRVVDGSGAAGRAGRDLPADPVRDALHGLSLPQAA